MKEDEFTLPFEPAETFLIGLLGVLFMVAAVSPVLFW
jgi:hypothetical protein